VPDAPTSNQLEELPATGGDDWLLFVGILLIVAGVAGVIVGVRK
jgi:LPXTG-motif cell wall-anchored protein